MLLATQLPSESSDPRNDQPLEGVAFASDIDTLLVANSGDSNSLSLSRANGSLHHSEALAHQLELFQFSGQNLQGTVARSGHDQSFFPSSLRARERARLLRENTSKPNKW